MTNNLKPRTLDIVVTKITKQTVYYKLAANEQEEHWRIPKGSTFNTKQLTVGKRYRVTTNTVTTQVWKFRQRKHVTTNRFDWVSVTEIAPQAKLQALSAKQRQASEALAAKPLVDNGTLFKW